MDEIDNNTCCLYYTVNTIFADALAALGARASAGMILTLKTGIFRLQHPKSWCSSLVLYKQPPMSCRFLTQSGLEKPNGDRNLGQHWLRWMACCLMGPSHYLNQCWLIMSGVLWNSPESNFIKKKMLMNLFCGKCLAITLVRLLPHLLARGQWVKAITNNIVEA